MGEASNQLKLVNCEEVAHNFQFAVSKFLFILFM